MARVEGSPIYRFFSKVNFDGPLILDTKCWEWMGAVNHEGYGQIWIEQRTVRAPRFILELKCPGLPKDLLTRHLCNNARCVNPDHVVPGTPKENAQDVIVSGRDRKTENRYSPEFAAQVRAEAAVPGVTRIAIARKHGMCVRTLRNILDGNRKKDTLTPEQLKARQNRKRLSPERIQEINRVYGETRNINETARRLDTHPATVRKFIRKAVSGEEGKA